MRILGCIAHPGLSPEVHDTLRLVFGKDLLDLVPVGEVSLEKPELVLSFKPRQPRKLEVHVIVGIQVIDADNLITTGKQRRRGLRTDETRYAGYENLHITGLP